MFQNYKNLPLINWIQVRNKDLFNNNHQKTVNKAIAEINDELERLKMSINSLRCVSDFYNWCKTSWFMVNFADLQIWRSWQRVGSKGNREETFHFHWAAWKWTEGSCKFYWQLSHKIHGRWQQNYLFHIIESSSRRLSPTLKRMISSELMTSIELTRISTCCKRIWGTQKKRSFIQSRKLSQVYLRTQV